MPESENKIKLHVGCGQVILPGYINIDGYDNTKRPEHFQTSADMILKAEELDKEFEPESVDEIRSHHMFEHISILDVDRTLRCWNKILKPNGLVWIETPDFEYCARAILSSSFTEEEKEVFYRHIFGSQVGPGEFHKNGLTKARLTYLLENYGFKVIESKTVFRIRKPKPIVFTYPAYPPLPDLIVKARKVSSPKAEILNSDYTYIIYRKKYPNPVDEEDFG
jgi:predicted SAM-dependent methyltransferase